jgi:TonB-linked SusC/RagA family outer membrane protein
MYANLNEKLSFKPKLRKAFITMKLTTLFLILGFGTGNAAGIYAQSVTFSLNMNNKTVKEVLNEIEKNSEFIFFYHDGVFDINRKVSIKVHNQGIDKILDKLFEGTDNGYTIDDRQVFIVQADQPAQNKITGKVTDPEGAPLPGVTVMIEKSTKGVITDPDGNYSIDVKPGDKLVFSFVGMTPQVIEVSDRTIINVTLQEKTDELEEVTVVAFGKQKKESVISSIQTVDTKDLVVPSSNLTTAFAGRIAGMISYQTSGEPGHDDASFFIRGVTSFGSGKVDPLILIDNMEISASDLAKLHPDDIASFSILKDATATALYGARGANGVILITTKEGREGKAKVNVRVENSFSSPTSTLDMADPITYMQLANEAAATRNPLAALPYSKSKIDNTIRGTNPYVYPAVDWMDMLIKNTAINQRVNMNISGGGTVARYYIAGSFSQDNGILKVDKRNNFNNNINYKKYLLRSNVNVNVTKSTEIIVRLHGTFDDNQGPMMGGSTLYRQILNVSPTRFPAYYEPDEAFKGVNHILFGGDMDADYLNPYAQMLKGYKQANNSMMMAQMELKQDFGALVKGLTGRIMGNTTRYGSFDYTMQYSPFFYSVMSYDPKNDQYQLYEINPTGGREYLDYSPGAKSVNSTTYGEASLSYNCTFREKHDVSGMLVGMIRQYLTANAKASEWNTELAASLPQRNIGVSGRFTYGYDNRYFGEFNFGYNGSEKFDKGHHWGFFPSVGVGWLVSNEPFWMSLKNTVSLLKIRGTYGLVGNDEISSTRFFYLSGIDPNGGRSFSTGYDFSGLNLSGYKTLSYANPNVGWETAYKSNLGIELNLFKDKVAIQSDIFREHRINVLQSRVDIPEEMGLWSTPSVNIGEANGSGIDLSVDYKQSFNADLWFIGRANFTYARSTYAYYEESDYAKLGVPWLLHKGRPVSQKWGYVAESLFVDENEVANSPRQDFGEYGAGDIKYKDMNKDGVINTLDEVPIGYPSTPEINYGFGFTAGYRNFDLSVFFSGSARSSFFIDPTAMQPFLRTTSDGLVLENGLAKFIADDHWTEQDQNPQALWPRFSNYVLDNNIQRSTWYMYDNAFLRLKSAEIGYSLPESIAKKAKFTSLRFYVSGTNLLLFSKFKIWDVELGNNGLNYPLQRVINLGINLSF